MTRLELPLAANEIESAFVNSWIDVSLHRTNLKRSFAKHSTSVNAPANRED